MGLAISSKNCWRLLGASILAGIAGTSLAAEEPGTLVIAGGAVSTGNAGIYEAFAAAMPDPDESLVVIISAASGEPVASMRRARDTLGHYGISADRVRHVRLAVMDDDSTDDVDERAWSGNAENPEEIAKVDAAGAIWISGGDQLRLVETLLAENGAPTPMLESIRRRYEAGAVIG